MRSPPKPRRASEALRGLTVANLFGEPSTRTRASFELAARRLGADVVNLDNTLSSRAKGETLARHRRTRCSPCRSTSSSSATRKPACRSMSPARWTARHRVVSAGEAHLSHPTQGLLDALTIRQCQGEFDRLSVVIVGDIAPLARRALRAPRTRDARRAGHPDRRAARHDAGGRRVRRRSPLRVARRWHRGRRRRDDAPDPARACGRRRIGGPRGVSPRIRAHGRAARAGERRRRSSCTRAR